MRRSVVLTSFVFGLAAPATALAAGVPVGPVQGQRGIGLPGSPVRFVAAPAGRNTVLERVTVNDRRVQSALQLRGQYGIPAAAIGGATTGLSADGHTLILEQFHGNAGPTHLLVVDTSTMRVRKRVVLQGWSSVDAISPSGRWMYLIHYPSWPNPTRYEVQAYDLSHGRLLAKPIVDPHDRGEAMTGFPVSRTMSPDGRWAYTLYQRPSGEPFVHALDTVGVRAVCIDLPSVENPTIGASQLRLTSGGASLQILVNGAVQATINTRTFAVSRPRASLPRAASQPAPQDQRATGSGGDWPWELVMLPIVALALAGAVLWRRARAAGDLSLR